MKLFLPRILARVMKRSKRVGVVTLTSHLPQQRQKSAPVAGFWSNDKALASRTLAGGYNDWVRLLLLTTTGQRVNMPQSSYESTENLLQN